MSLLKDLNGRDKITVVIVTHDMEVAKSTRRQIRMFDGEIVK
jgi:ABC-type lipoprotein export system ATPase subunit